MKKLIAIPLILFLVACCGTVKESWDNMSNNEKAVIIVSGLQTQLDGLFTIGKDYVNSHPDKQEIWKTKIIPAFDTANKTLLSCATLIGKENLSAEEIAETMIPLIKSIAELLKSMGVDGKLINSVTGG